MDFPEKYKKLWSDWDIRVFILLSLSVQIVLIFLSRLRKTSASMWIRMLVWTSYLLANWVADFALGQLSNAMDESSSSNAIIAFWAPFLILHLGGPDTITAYSIEDNELWARHLLSLGYELIIAFYVLFRSMPNTRLLTPTILIFFVAIIKYIERSYSLYKASTESFRRSIDSSVRKLPSNISLTISNMEDLNALNKAFGLYSTCKPFFIDATPHMEVYKETLEFTKIIELSKEIITKDVLTVMSLELSYAYDELYTKAAINHSRVGYVLRALCSICILLAFSLYVFAPKDGFDKFDVAITYVLLVASVLLDAMATIMLLFSDWMIVTLLNVKKLGNWSKLLAEHIAKIKRVCLTRRYWSGELPQLNLISNCLKNFAPNKAPRRNMIDWIKEKLGLVHEIKLYMNWLDDMETYTLQTQQPIQATEELMNIIATYIHSPLNVSWEKFNEPVGLTVLQQVKNTPTWVVPSFVKLIEGLSFDQQVLVWHICTELCFYWKSESLHPLHPHQIEIATEEKKPRGAKRKSSEMEVCKYLSNYMMYVVFMRPDIIYTKGGASTFLLWHACYDMVLFIRSCGDDHHLLMPNAKVEEVCKKMMTTPMVKGLGYLSLFGIARVLAHLMLVIEEEERWQVVTVAWVELLLQGARNTKAIMHMKQLSRGGELLSFIWLFTKHVMLSEHVDLQVYINRNVVDMANELLDMIKIHLQNQC